MAGTAAQPDTTEYSQRQQESAKRLALFYIHFQKHIFRKGEIIMSNAEAIAMTRRQEDGYDSFNDDVFISNPVVVRVKGTVRIYRARKEEDRCDQH